MLGGQLWRLKALESWHSCNTAAAQDLLCYLQLTTAAATSVKLRSEFGDGRVNMTCFILFWSSARSNAMKNTDWLKEVWKDLLDLLDLFLPGQTWRRWRLLWGGGRWWWSIDDLQWVVGSMASIKMFFDNIDLCVHVPQPIEWKRNMIIELCT